MAAHGQCRHRRMDTDVNRRCRARLYGIGHWAYRRCRPGVRHRSMPYCLSPISKTQSRKRPCCVSIPDTQHAKINSDEVANNSTASLIRWVGSEDKQSEETNQLASRLTESLEAIENCRSKTLRTWNTSHSRISSLGSFPTACQTIRFKLSRKDRFKLSSILTQKFLTSSSCDTLAIGSGVISPPSYFFDRT